MKKIVVSCVVVASSCAVVAPPSEAAVVRHRPVSQRVVATADLESVATKAGTLARAVAMSVIGVALAIVSVVLALRRDFRDAIAAFAVGLVAVLFATPAGEDLLRTTVTSLFG